MIKTFLKWLVQSSENPSQLSLTLKGFMVAVIPSIVMILGIFNIQVPSDDVANIGNSIIVIVQAIVTAIGAAIMIYGFVRKLLNRAIPWPTETEVIEKVGEPVNS